MMRKHPTLTVDLGETYPYMGTNPIQTCKGRAGPQAVATMWWSRAFRGRWTATQGNSARCSDQKRLAIAHGVHFGRLSGGAAHDWATISVLLECSSDVAFALDGDRVRQGQPVPRSPGLCTGLHGLTGTIALNADRIRVWCSMLDKRLDIQ
ncbi:hypothetical protein OH77DRAFT_145265 [Trametes cingulata]|nr:hypothetical protein OH77DRAFT_145265 [Trametes cingulata]